MYALSKTTPETLRDKSLGINIIPRLGNRLMLYDYGKEHVPWVAGYIHDSGGSLTEEADHLYWITQTSGTDERARVTDIPIDVTPYTKACILWYNDGTDSSYNRSAFIVSTKKMSSYGTYDARFYTSGKFDIRPDHHIVDISKLTGKHYIRVHGVAAGAGTTITCRWRAYKIWLER